jgi:3-phosphoshikimate 1-carboxyvinyltransferase
LTNRALICAALADGESHIEHASDSDDTSLLANGLNQLGVLVRRIEDRLVVSGKGGRLFAPRFPIPVGNAGTTLRFLLSLAALADGPVVLEGSARIAERPVQDLLDALSAMGVRTEFRTGVPRYVVHGGKLDGGDVHMRSDKSSQFLTSLLMVSPYARSDVRIVVEGRLSSASYVRITEDVMNRFGVVPDHDPSGGSFHVRAGATYRPARIEIEADASGASYPFAIAAITGGEVLAERIHRSSLQGDIGFLEVLRRMGCEAEETSEGVLVRRKGRLCGVECDMNVMPDVVPSLVAVALFAEGPTVIHNVAHLRYKESDRLTGLADELRTLGAEIEVLDDGLRITPSTLHGAALDPHDDHRLAMSFAVIGLRVPGISVKNPGCVTKSFPRFWDEFDRLSRAQNETV